MHVKSVGNKFIVRPSDVEPISASGLHVVQMVESKSDRGEVVSVPDDEIDVSLGDTVIFQRKFGHEIEHEGELFLSINREHILAVVG
jgi:co-chaperonin GroES (HSP10)